MDNVNEEESNTNNYMLEKKIGYNSLQTMNYDALDIVIDILGSETKLDDEKNN